MSGEHYVSDSILRMLGATNISTRDYPWNVDGELKTVGISSFKTKVLCQEHNSALSKADEAAKAFAMALAWAGLQIRTSVEFESASEVLSVDGDQLERWVLKTLVVHQLASVLKDNGKPVATLDRTQAVDLLFGQRPWPPGWGLYVSRTASDPLTKESVRAPWGGIQPLVRKDGELIGGLVWLGGVALALALFQPAPDETRGPFANAVYRPGAVAFRTRGFDKGAVLLWSDSAHHEQVIMSVTFKKIGEP
ncbi:hypothetical protein C1I92_06155 [Jiangella anatolica]|uniref:Uncharacterized protein n=2 Tax=Jiangella anatolica TaxID=2670374 RepID=A0A2W2BZ86_9ACTN|nr:hypothetical protein C1I92_06155 [Jiangella anatolica]